MSLQKAYSLLLGDTTSFAQYTVYASLSRVGYRIIRHNRTDTTKNKEKHSVNSVNDTEMADICNDSTVKENYCEVNSNIMKDIKSIDESDDIVMKSVENSENIIEKNVPIDNKISMNVTEEMNEGNSTNMKESVDGDEADKVIDNTASTKDLSGAVHKIENIEMNEETENSSNRVTKGL